MKIFKNLFIMIFLISFQINASTTSVTKVTGIKMYLISQDGGLPKQETWKSNEAIFVGDSNGILFVVEVAGPEGYLEEGSYVECTIESDGNIIFREQSPIYYIYNKEYTGFWFPINYFETSEDLKIKTIVFSNGKSSAYTKQLKVWWGD